MPFRFCTMTTNWTYNVSYVSPINALRRLKYSSQNSAGRPPGTRPANIPNSILIGKLSSCILLTRNDIFPANTGMMVTFPVYMDTPAACANTPISRIQHMGICDQTLRHMRTTLLFCAQPFGVNGPIRHAPMSEVWHYPATRTFLNNWTCTGFSPTQFRTAQASKRETASISIFVTWTSTSVTQ